MVTIDYDRAGLVKALLDYLATTTRSIEEVITQRLLNIAGRAFDLISPAQLASGKEQVKAYLSEPLSSRVKYVSGADFGNRKFAVKRGRAVNQLQRVHLILQARRAKQGLPGLYGEEMRRKAGAAKAKAQMSVGFLKSLFLPIITYLNGKARYKFPFSKTHGLARWPDSAGTYAIRHSNTADLLSQGFEVGAKLFLDASRPESIVAHAVSEAAAAETEEIRNHIAHKMEEEARKAGSG